MMIKHYETLYWKNMQTYCWNLSVQSYGHGIHT